MPSTFVLAQTSAAQAAAWLMYHIAQMRIPQATHEAWMARDGEKGFVDSIAEAAVLVRNLFDAIPRLDEDVSPYDLYPAYAERIVEEESTIDPFMASYRRALFHTLAGLHEPDKFVEWEIEGTGMVFESAWAAASCLSPGHTLLCKALADPATNMPTRTLLRVSWVDGKMHMWMIGALQYLSQYQATRPVWHSVEGSRHCLSEMTAPEYCQAPLVLLHQNKPYDNLQQEGVMVYLADEIWEVL